jgi:hypothetical protein
MGEIFKSPIPCDPSKLPTNLSLPDYVFQKLNKLLPQVADNPWLVRYFNNIHKTNEDEKLILV